MRMFSYQWFKENDKNIVNRLISVKDIKWYIDNFIEDNKDILDNMILIGDHVKEIEMLYKFRNITIEYAKEKNLKSVMYDWSHWWY